ncbi:hypothetical protein BJX70DRAFT_403946 [Aspergillus crustosus]
MSHWRFTLPLAPSDAKHLVPSYSFTLEKGPRQTPGMESGELNYPISQWNTTIARLGVTASDPRKCTTGRISDDDNMVPVIIVQLKDAASLKAIRGANDLLDKDITGGAVLHQVTVAASRREQGQRPLVVVLYLTTLIQSEVAQYRTLSVPSYATSYPPPTVGDSPKSSMGP